MILAAEDVIGLQFVLMDAAKRFVERDGADAVADALLSNAAALDYALLLSSECGDEPIDDASAVAGALRETMTRAARSALDIVERSIASHDGALDDFVERHVRSGRLFATLRSLRDRGVTDDDDVSFRALTLASDVSDRRR